VSYKSLAAALNIDFFPKVLSLEISLLPEERVHSANIPIRNASCRNLKDNSSNCRSKKLYRVMLVTSGSRLFIARIIQAACWKGRFISYFSSI